MRDRGYLTIDALVALTLAVVMAAAVAALFLQNESIVQAQPEAIDMQERVRVMADALSKDIGMAGAGLYAGSQGGSLIDSFAPLMPRKIGLTGPDPSSLARPDAITVVYVPTTNVQTTTSSTLGAGTPLTVAAPSNCPAGQPVCGVQSGMSLVVFDQTAHADLFSVASVQPSSASIQPHAPLLYTYPPGAKVAQVEARSYYLDAANAQLRQYDGYLSDVPVADDVVGLTFEYFGDPSPPTQPKPAAGVDNCLYDATGALKPLPILSAAGDGLAPLPLAMFTDGPWCGSGGMQFDADLLRVRAVRVSLRAQAAQPAFRAASPAFARSGTSRSSRRWLPDLAATFRVTPRNLRPAP